MIKYFSFLTLLLFVVVSCSTTEQAVNDTIENARENFRSENEKLVSNLNLESYRTQLSDAYAYRENKIPDGFNQIKVQQEVEKDLYEGYRVQIYSGQSVVQADTTAANFRAWADTTIVGYQPDTYTFFRTPYYRVHVGDFHERDRAILFSNIVKRYFRDAWVVYDRVNPTRVPADTTEIKTQ
ncbi:MULTISPECIES: SPOR domain-containing protein [Gracilimonas]|uniref:SPOR domain-containing protein n=1 Tax=Gracilimonas sediminicola TaxID=2952158 RepID=A0A9X2REW6_9BACT|nr:SPOR domain-containing protein [Gracilimonas sediminicola]MCP9289979.1 SPOR domain-containing protein [Gracilimonas sediminicola]